MSLHECLFERIHEIITFFSKVVTEKLRSDSNTSFASANNSFDLNSPLSPPPSTVGLHLYNNGGNRSKVEQVAAVENRTPSSNAADRPPLPGYEDSVKRRTEDGLSWLKPPNQEFRNSKFYSARSVKNYLQWLLIGLIYRFILQCFYFLVDLNLRMIKFGNFFATKGFLRFHYHVVITWHTWQILKCSSHVIWLLNSVTTPVFVHNEMIHHKTTFVLMKHTFCI